MNPYEKIGEEKDEVRELIETSGDMPEAFLTFSNDFENMWGYNLGVFKHRPSEVVVLASDDEMIVTDSRTISRFSRIEAEYDLDYDIPDNVEKFIYEASITSPESESDSHANLK